jgi:hypothetical protein
LDSTPGKGAIAVVFTFGATAGFAEVIGECRPMRDDNPHINGGAIRNVRVRQADNASLLNFARRINRMV